MWRCGLREAGFEQKAALLNVGATGARRPHVGIFETMVSARLIAIALIMTVQCPSQANARTFMGNVATSAPWAHIAHFAFKAERESIVFDMPMDASEASGSTMEEQMGTAKLTKPDRGYISVQVRYSYGTRLSLLAYFDNPPAPSELNSENFDRAQTWQQVYESTRDCQWRDLQARRWGNAWDLTEAPPKGGDASAARGFSHHGLWMSRTPEGSPSTNPEDWVERDVVLNEMRSSMGSLSELSKSSIADIDMQYPYRFFNMSVAVSTRRDRLIYLALANCLPGKPITAKEAATGVSDDPRYRVATNQENLQQEQQLVCAGKDSFCQGPLLWGVSYVVHAVQPFASADGMVESLNLGADEQGELESLIVLLVLQNLLHAWLVYLISRLSRLEGSSPMPPRRQHGASKYPYNNSSQRDPGFADHNWGTMTRWHNKNKLAAPLNYSRKRPLCPNKTCIYKRPIFSLVYVSSLLQLVAVLLRMVYFGVVDTDNATRARYHGLDSVWRGRPALPETIVVVRSHVYSFARNISSRHSAACKGLENCATKISARGRVKLAGFATAYFMLLLTCFIWEHFLQDHALAKERFGQGPGTVVLLARTATAGWFVYACITTIRRKGRKKRPAYRKFCCFYSAYLVSLLSSWSPRALFRCCGGTLRRSFLITGPRCCIGGIVFLRVPSQLRRSPSSAAIAGRANFRQQGWREPNESSGEAAKVKSGRRRKRSATGQ